MLTPILLNNLVFLSLSKFISMQKKIFLSVFILFFTIIYSQSYERKWGTMIPVYDQPQQTFSAVRNILSTPFIAEVNPKTGNLFVVTENSNEILEFKSESPISKSIYKIPGFTGSSKIEQIKFDSNNNLIISGRTINPDLATSNSFSTEMIATFNTGHSFIAKISNKGELAWFSYFYEIPLHSMSLTIDKNDNIYILNKRFRGDILDSALFQKNGDAYSRNDFQDAITKFDTNGKHIWSTFYTKDESKINAIMASSKGIYIYGMHLGDNISSNYFGTRGSFLETTSNKAKSTSLVFLSKFDFDGKRLWSTYFGDDVSYVPYPVNSIVKNPTNLTVIGDDAYFITLHNSSLSKSKQNLATDSVFLSTPPFSIENHTLTKFSGSGSREWTTYLNTYGVLYKSLQNEELFISTTVNPNQKNIGTMVTQNAYQTKQSGMQDVLTYSLSLDGKTLKYATFYGYEGNDIGFSLPSLGGFYTIGFSSNYTQEKSLFATKKASLKKFKLYNDNSYVGNFLGYFSKKEK